MRGTNANLRAKAELGATGCDFRKNGGWLGESALSMGVLAFGMPLQLGGGGFDGGGDASDNNGSNPTGTRFSS